MSSRRLVVEAAFGFGPFDSPAAGDWVNLTRPDSGETRAMQAEWQYGRDDNLDAFATGTASILLWNRDRHLDPDYSGSPYAGDLLPRVPVRIRSQDTSTLAYTDEFYGYVEGGWEQIVVPKGMAACRIQLSDLLSVIEGYELGDVFEQAVLGLSPIGFWVLDTAEGEQVADLGSSRTDGTVTGEGVKLGDRVIVPGHVPAARFDVLVDAGTGEVTNGFVSLGRSPLPIDVATYSVMVTFLARSAGDLNWRTLFVQGNGTLNPPGSGIGFHLAVQTDGTLWLGNRFRATTGSKETSTSVVDGRAHITVGTGTSVLYLDSATATGVAGPTVVLGTTNGVGIGGSYGLPAQDCMDGWIGAAAVFDYTVSAGNVGTILDGYTKLDGLRTDEHIAWALDQVGVPAGVRDLDQGTVYLGPANTKGRGALEWIRQVTDTEGGELYVDHRNGGVVRFRNRYARDLEASGSTSQATFSDAPGGVAVIRYSPDGLDIAPNGLDSIVNQATVSWSGGNVTVSDTTSIDAYGPRTRSIQTVATTANQARSTAEWLVVRRKDPASRVRGCIAAAHAAHSVDDLAHGLEIGDRVTFRFHPTALTDTPVGTATSAALHVEGIRNSFEGMVWETAFRFSSAPTFVPWIWGTGAWGTTAYWG